MNNSKTPNVSVEELAPADLPSALGSLQQQLPCSFVSRSKVGMGHEIFLQWALNDIEEAAKANRDDDSARATINAVMNARRALSCLVDQYLQRDGFQFCKNFPKKAEERMQILVHRGVFTSLASQSLKRAVNQRNEVEHKYTSINLADGQEVVHKVQITIENAVARSNPFDSPALFGTILGGYGTSNGVVEGCFKGWSGVAFLFVTTVQQPWAGIIIPKNETEAVVRKVEIGMLSTEQLLEALSIAESRLADQSRSGCTPDLWHVHLQIAGLL